MISTGDETYSMALRKRLNVHKGVDRFGFEEFEGRDVSCLGSWSQYRCWIIGFPKEEV